MNTVDRFKAVYKGEPVDRAPICAWLGLPLLKRITGKGPRPVLEGIVGNPLGIVEIQEELGLDPIVITVDDRWFSMHHYWRLLYSWPDEALETWQVEQEIVAQGEDMKTYRFTATTPEGPITWAYNVSEGQVAETEPALEDEDDLDLVIKYMPEPESLNQDKLTAMVDAVGDRAFFTHNFIGVWGEAANMRGLVNLSMDIIERPAFVKRLSEFLMNRAVRRVKHLAKTGVHSILYDQSWVGVGYSPRQYREFMLPYDKEVVKAAQEAGLLVSFHNCGRGMSFLEEMVSTGAESLETLSPEELSGDFVLAEVKQRVGDRVTLNGGVNERIFPTATEAEVREEVKRCLDVAASDGRYILRPCGQILQAKISNVEVFADAGRKYGRY